jgi:hypothetical protein
MSKEDLMWLGIFIFTWPIVIPLVLVLAALAAQGLLKVGCRR